MKAITLWQPWASLIALGEKRIETRSWKTDYRGPLAIHAAAKATDKIAWEEPFWSALKPLHRTKCKGALEDIRGSIVATCNLTACYKVQAYRVVKNDRCQLERAAFLDAGNRIIKITGLELEFGDYTTGGYAWILEDIKPLEEPIPVRGSQRLWEWEGLK